MPFTRFTPRGNDCDVETFEGCESAEDVLKMGSRAPADPYADVRIYGWAIVTMMAMIAVVFLLRQDIHLSDQQRSAHQALFEAEFKPRCEAGASQEELMEVVRTRNAIGWRFFGWYCSRGKAYR